MEISTIRISENHGHDICPPEAIPGSINVIPCPFQRFKMIFSTLVIRTCLRIAWLINIKIVYCWQSLGEIDNDGKCFM
jgi:hypothetical protein